MLPFAFVLPLLSTTTPWRCTTVIGFRTIVRGGVVSASTPVATNVRRPDPCGGVNRMSCIPDTPVRLNWPCPFVALGCSAGYWAMFVQIAAEQFGTNYRATVTTSVPNLVRGSTIPMTLGFQALIPHFGVIGAGLTLGFSVIVIAIAATIALPETFARELDYEEIV